MSAKEQKAPATASKVSPFPVQAAAREPTHVESPACEDFLKDGKAHALPDTLIENLLCRGDRFILGTASSHKSCILLDLAFSVATGSQWMGLNCKKGKVLYLSFELGAGFFCEHLDQICKARKFTGRPDNLIAWDLRKSSYYLSEITGQIAERIRTLKQDGADIALIIVGHLYRALGEKDKRSGKAEDALVYEIEKTAHEINAAVAVAMPLLKGSRTDKEAVDRITGRPFARNAAVLTLTRQKDYHIVDMFSANWPELNSYVVKWEAPLMVKCPPVKPEDLQNPAGGRPAFVDDDLLLQFLPDGGAQQNDWYSSIGDLCSDKTFRNALNKLAADNRIDYEAGPNNSKIWRKWRQPPRNDPYRCGKKVWYKPRFFRDTILMIHAKPHKKPHNCLLPNSIKCFRQASTAALKCGIKVWYKPRFLDTQFE